MILQLVQRLMNLETQVKSALQGYRQLMIDSNKCISMPNYENLLNAKRFHLRKLVQKVEFDNSAADDCEFQASPEAGGRLRKEQKLKQNVRNPNYAPRSLLLYFNSKKLYQLQIEQKLKITPETLRNCLFFIIQSPQKIQINFRRNYFKLTFWDPIDCQHSYDVLVDQVLNH
mmetsp:Transcript_11173/g.18779  ORF Transcript_11173/g.18779 Transcript_11173/m.18779 type:complete len:172 (-) Transcript_11173:363-878(-)